MDQHHKIVNERKILVLEGMSLGGLKGLGPLGEIIDKITGPKEVGEPINLLNKAISIVIGVLTAITFVYFIFLFFTAALNWLSAGGDQKKIETAGKQITNALIGLAIVIAAISIINLLGSILGISILNPFGFIKEIWK